MIPYLGDFVEDDVVYLMFNTFSSDDPSASCTITNLLNTDVHIHKDDSTTQRNNAAGITVSVNFDGITGSHLIKIDTSDNTVAGFWVTGHDYFVRIEGTTIDGATINAVVGHFSIQNRFMRGTAGANTTVPDAAGVAPTAIEIRQEMDNNSTKMAPSQTLNDYKATGFSTHTAAAVKTAIEAAGSSIALILADTNELQGNQGAWATATGFSTHSAADVKTSIEAAGSHLAIILADTGELQTNQGNWLTATGFSTHNAAAVWSVAARVLTANTNLNDLTAAEMKAEVVAALADIKLDHLINIAVDTDWATTVHLDSVIGHMADVGTSATFSRTTDALEAIRNRGDAAWTTGAGGSAPTVGEIRAEMEGNGYFLDLIKADTNELQTDWANDGRLDVLLDACNTTTPPTAVTNAIAVWDRLLTGATHNIPTSAGRRVREIAAFAIHGGTAQSGTTTSITLTAAASANDGVYNRNLIAITEGTGAGQTRQIADYNGTTKVASVDREWRISPDATSVYQITSDNVFALVDQGMAQAGTSTTITLRAYASSVDNTYLCNQVAIIAGTGRGQARLVGAYNGTTKVATICGDNWVTIPDTTSVYVLLPYGTTCTSCVGSSALTQIRTEMDNNSTKLSSIRSIVNFIRTKLL